MELICIGFLAGMLVAFITFAVITNDRMDKRKSDGDSDMRIYKPVRDRVDRSDSAYYKPTTEEIIDTLYNIKLSLRGHEKICVEKAIAIIEKVVEMISRGENNEL